VGFFFLDFFFLHGRGGEGRGGCIISGEMVRKRSRGGEWGI